MEAINSQNSNTTIDEDNINKLPDLLIHHILSFVKVKQAFQTCILSKRWRYIWTSLPFMNFDISDLPQQSYRCHYHLDRLVDNVLSLRDNRCFDMRRFHLIGGYAAIKSISHLHRWIISVARSNVEDIYVQFNGSYNNNDREFRVPDCVFTCKSLTKLELDLSMSCKIILPNFISLPRLRYLKLNNPSFDHDALTKLCTNFPLLEHLDSSGISSYEPLNINISSHTLKHLSLGVANSSAPLNITISSLSLKHFEVHIGYHNSIHNTLRLCAANLVYLVLSNLDYMLLEDVSSLVTADVGVQLKPRKLNAKFWRIHAPDTLKSLKSLHNVKDLTISLQPLKDVIRVQELLQEQPFEFSNLQRLKLQNISHSTDSMHAIASLVKISPIIESIKLELCQDVETSYNYNYSDTDAEQEMESDPHTGEATVDLEGLLADTMKQLKSVEINGLQGSDNELEFIQILMKNAMVLKKMVLRTQLYRSRIEKFCEEE
ncbi:putative F-box/LRR-repeat protein At5g41840 [Papaver somniferum]|uniref:putative F-box/LRR-repeat protein At5g41840 n=1 Tax=Papaver somniferum TaxID=3469 RepID=UPI000E6F54D8|nr:putative F-box/LRR-repeat protein At5g41840 [Papaver somniferum]